MRETILHVCASAFLTAQQIASLLGRSKKRLQDEFLGPKCVAELRVMRYLETANHMQQAYRAASPDKTREQPHEPTLTDHQLALRAATHHCLRQRGAKWHCGEIFASGGNSRRRLMAATQPCRAGHAGQRRPWITRDKMHVS